MTLSLSTTAAPSLALGALDAAARGRGLDGLELVVETGDVAALVAGARAAGARIVALRAERIDDATCGGLAWMSGELSAPASVPLAAVNERSLPGLAKRFADAGGTLLLGVGTELDQVVAALDAIRRAGDPPCLGLAWELRPSVESLKSSSAVLLAARARLGLVRLHGGGPEQRDQDGRGVGPLFVDLAISGYGGSIVLTPSLPEARPRWSDWLASKKLAGCGSGFPSGEHELDVRDVEPRDRLATILGAFGALPLGATLKITLDHDPSCMYFALEESQPPGTFAFRKVGDGPEVWRAEVTRT